MRLPGQKLNKGNICETSNSLEYWTREGQRNQLKKGRKVNLTSLLPLSQKRALRDSERAKKRQRGRIDNVRLLTRKRCERKGWRAFWAVCLDKDGSVQMRHVAMDPCAENKQMMYSGHGYGAFQADSDRF